MSPRYFVLAGHKVIRAADVETGSPGQLVWPWFAPFRRRRVQAKWSARECRGFYGSKGHRFLLLDLRCENILFGLNLVEKDRGYDRLLEVTIPARADAPEYVEEHRDGASSFVLREGVLADRIQVQSIYLLNQFEGMSSLVEAGLFKKRESGLFENLGASDYGEWLIRENLLDLFTRFEVHFRISQMAPIAASLNRVNFFRHWSQQSQEWDSLVRDECLQIAKEKGWVDLETLLATL